MGKLSLNNQMNGCILYIGLLFFSGNAAFSQSALRYYDPMPENEVPPSAPEWMKRLFDKDVNFFEMDSLFQVYLEENPDAKLKINGTRPTVNFYRRWKKAYEPFVQPDGSLQLPLASDVLKRNEQNNRNAARMRKANMNKSLRKWEVIGPFQTYDFRTKKITPAQVNVYRVDIAETNRNILYCGTETGMVFKTFDKGLNWEACAFDHDFGGHILSLAIDPKDENIVWVGTQLSLWKTEDGGATWQKPAGWQHFRGRIDAIAIDPYNSDHLIVGCAYNTISEITAAGYVYQTFNAGNTFDVAVSGRGMDVKFNRHCPGEIYVAAKEREGFVNFHKSIDGGKTFAIKTLPSINVIAARMVVYKQQICMLATSNPYTVADHLRGKPYVLRSLDLGESWVAHDNLFDCDCAPVSDKKGGHGYYDMAIAINEKNPDEIFYGLINSYRWDFSTSQGAPVGGYGRYCFPFDLHPDHQSAICRDGELYVSTDGGINYTTDFFHKTDNHEVRTKGIYASEFWGFDHAWNEDIMVGGRYHNGNMALAGDLYGEHSIAISGAEEPTGYVFLSNPRKVAFSDAPDVFLPDRKEDEFKEFSYYNFPTESRFMGTYFKYHPWYAQCFLIGKENTLYITTDDGESTTSLYTFAGVIRDYDFDRNNPDVIYVLTADMKMHKSNDGGKSFRELKQHPDMPYYQSSMAINPNNTQEIWMANRVEGGVFRSRNGGESWDKINKNLENYFVRSFIATGDKYNTVYALVGHTTMIEPSSGEIWGTTMVWYYNDLQQEWLNVSNGLPGKIVGFRMLPFYGKGVIRLASERGIWEFPLVKENQRPIANPMILNVRKNQTTVSSEIQFESYSVAPFENTKWEWTFTHKATGKSITSNIRNPKIDAFPSHGSYDVTLRIITENGEVSSKTVPNMFSWQGAYTDLPQLPNYDKAIIDKTVMAQGENLKLTLPENNGKDALFLWLDASGKMISQTKITEAVTILQTEHLFAGTYIFVVQFDDRKQTVGRVIIK